MLFICVNNIELFIDCMVLKLSVFANNIKKRYLGTIVLRMLSPLTAQVVTVSGSDSVSCLIQLKSLFNSRDLCIPRIEE